MQKKKSKSIKGEFNWKVVNLKGKTRKGDYIYVRTPEKKSRYFKYGGRPMELEAIVNYSKDRYVKKKKLGSLKGYLNAYSDRVKRQRTEKNKLLYRHADRYLSRVAKKGDINRVFQKGISSVNVKDLYKIGSSAEKKVYQTLLKRLVLDKEILNVLVQEQNLNKIKHRFENRVSIIGQDERVLIAGNKANVTLNQLKHELIGSVKKGDSIGDYTAEHSTVKKLSDLGYNPIKLGKGNVGRIQVNIIFRKGA